MNRSLARIAPLALLLSAPISLHAQVTTSHVLSAPWGQLVANSETSFDVASAAMRQTAAHFEYLFGELPHPIGVVVEDSSSEGSNALTPEARPLVLIAGSVRWNGQGRAELDTMVRFMAANSWMQAFAQDWLRLGAVTLVADGDASAHAFMRTHVGHAIPLRGLFALRLGANDDLSMVGPEAASVLSYLRAMEGVTAMRDFFGMLSNGSDVSNALSALPRYATIESLEIAWRRWLSAAPTDAVLPTTGVR